MMDSLEGLESALERRKIVLLLTSRLDYPQLLMEVSSVLSRRFERVCYTNFIKPYNTLIRDFGEYNLSSANAIDAGRFFFVDGVEKTAELQYKVTFLGYVFHPLLAMKNFFSAVTANHVYLNTLTDVTAINQRILSTIWERRSQALLVDSIQSLSQYMGAADISRMLHGMTARMRAFRCAGVFPVLLNDNGKDLVKAVHPLFDETIVVK